MRGSVACMRPSRSCMWLANIHDDTRVVAPRGSLVGFDSGRLVTSKCSLADSTCVYVCLGAGNVRRTDSSQWRSALAGMRSLTPFPPGAVTELPSLACFNCGDAEVNLRASQAVSGHAEPDVALAGRIRAEAGFARIEAETAETATAALDPLVPCCHRAREGRGCGRPRAEAEKERSIERDRGPRNVELHTGCGANAVAEDEAVQDIDNGS